MSAAIVIRNRYSGLPGKGHGGYCCGLLGKRLGRAAEVTLRAAPPLEQALPVGVVKRHRPAGRKPWTPWRAGGSGQTTAQAGGPVTSRREREWERGLVVSWGRRSGPRARGGPVRPAARDARGCGA